MHDAFSSERNAHVFSGKKTPPRRVNNQSWWFWKFAKMYENINWYLIAECPLQQRRPLARSRRCWWKRGTLPPAQRREKWPWKPTKQGWRGRALKTCPGVAGLLRLLSQATDVEMFWLVKFAWSRLAEICQTVRFMPEIFTKCLILRPKNQTFDSSAE